MSAPFLFDGIWYKKCTKCVICPLSDFYSNGKGRRSTCKKCHDATAKLTVAKRKFRPARKPTKPTSKRRIRAPIIGAKDCLNLYHPGQR